MDRFSNSRVAVTLLPDPAIYRPVKQVNTGLLDKHYRPTGQALPAHRTSITGLLDKYYRPARQARCLNYLQCLLFLHTIDPCLLLRCLACLVFKKGQRSKGEERNG